MVGQGLSFYAVQSIVLRALQKAGISSAASEKIGLPSAQKVIGQLICEQSRFKLMVDGYLLSPPKDIMWVIAVAVIEVVVSDVIVVVILLNLLQLLFGCCDHSLSVNMSSLAHDYMV